MVLSRKQIMYVIAISYLILTVASVLPVNPIPTSIVLTAGAVSLFVALHDGMRTIANIISKKKQVSMSTKIALKSSKFLSSVYGVIAFLCMLILPYWFYGINDTNSTLGNYLTFAAVAVVFATKGYEENAK